MLANLIPFQCVKKCQLGYTDGESLTLVPENLKLKPTGSERLEHGHV